MLFEVSTEKSPIFEPCNRKSASVMTSRPQNALHWLYVGRPWSLPRWMFRAGRSKLVEFAWNKRLRTPEPKFLWIKGNPPVIVYYYTMKYIAAQKYSLKVEYIYSCWYWIEFSALVYNKKCSSSNKQKTKKAANNRVFSQGLVIYVNSH